MSDNSSMNDNSSALARFCDSEVLVIAAIELALAILSLAVNLLGDWPRHALNPRLS
jgi:ABC-type dipeptide/oligopeptide/nickel transport system permease subunit